jgi:uncharacterized RDD family membrane protein YckC
MEKSYPALSDRIQSTFIDSLFIVFLMFVTSAILDRYEQAPDWIRITIFVGLWAIYEPLSTSFGGTIGNRIKGLRVRQYNNEHQRINIGQAFLRYILKVLLGWISFVTIHSNAQRRAIHDYASGSVMVKATSAVA